MSLTFDDICSFLCPDTIELIKYDNHITKSELKDALDDSVCKGYLKLEAPKKALNRSDLIGYNIVSGKLSFEISNILDPYSIAPTMVAMDVTKMAVPDTNNGLRRLTVREGLRLQGFPEQYSLDSVNYSDAFDLLGNSVSVNVVELVSKRLIKVALYNDLHNSAEHPKTISVGLENYVDMHSACYELLQEKECETQMVGVH